MCQSRGRSVSVKGEEKCSSREGREVCKSGGKRNGLVKREGKCVSREGSETILANIA